MNILDRIINKIWRSLPIPNSKISIDNRHYKVPRFLRHNYYKSNYNSEPWFVELMTRINDFISINSFVDVGVNIGQTLLKIKSINSKVQYTGIEANPFCTSVVQSIIRINSISNCTLLPLGLSDKPGVLPLNVRLSQGLSDSSASLIEGFRQWNESSVIKQLVPTMPFDEIVNSIDLNGIDLIKIDIEGGELEAFKGMLKSIETFKPWLVVEVLPSYDLSNEFRIKRQQELAHHIRTVNYQIWQIRNKRERITFHPFDEFPIHANLDECDYLLLPKEVDTAAFFDSF